MPDARERVTKNRSGDREARLARALRENLKRRKARVRASESPIPGTGSADAEVSDIIDAPDGCRAPQRRNPASKRD
jgi:hypothetical protein